MLTQQSSTLEQYHSVANRIIIEFDKCTGRDWRIHPLRLIEWVACLRPRWSPATWRVYRAAMTNVIRGEFPNLVEEATLILNNASVTLQAKPTKSCRIKKLLPEHLTLLTNYAKSKRSSNLSLAILMLRGAELVGLRPHEWFGSKQEGGCIVINNSKHTNGRAFGPVRHIKLEATSDEENALIDYIIEYANKRETDELWRKRVKSVRMALGRATAELGIRGLHLYSGRHQFSANAKFAGLSHVEIAALMGHASQETATTHYGRRSAGRIGGLKVRPAPMDVSTVADLNVGRNPREYQHPDQTTPPLPGTPSKTLG
jgi:integrase